MKNVNPQAEALSQLIDELGIENLSQDRKNEFIIKMTESLLKRIFLETMKKLDENGREEYEKISEGEIEPEKVEEFFRKKISNYDEMTQGVIEEFKSEMMATNK